jgi:hypothetical protein
MMALPVRTSSDRTPLARMLPRVIGSIGSLCPGYHAAIVSRPVAVGEDRRRTSCRFLGNGSYLCASGWISSSKGTPLAITPVKWKPLHRACRIVLCAGCGRADRGVVLLPPQRGDRPPSQGADPRRGPADSGELRTAAGAACKDRTRGVSAHAGAFRLFCAPWHLGGDIDRL